MSDTSKEQNNTNLERRDLLKGLATVPIAGVFLVNLWRKMSRDRAKKANLLSNLIQKKSAPAAIKSMSNSRHLNIGIIGYGGRGSHLVRGTGFATKGWTDTVSENARKNKLDKQFETFMTQEDLNCSLIGVCDLFDVNAELGLNASQNDVRPGGKPKATATRYRHYKDLLADDDIDAVIIATPDHWHSRISIDAAKAGKHVLCEKSLATSSTEAEEMVTACRTAGVLLQEAFMWRHNPRSHRAKEMITSGEIGTLRIIPGESLPSSKSCFGPLPKLI